MSFDAAAAVQTIAQAANWGMATPDEQGVYHYFLEENLDLDIQSPDGRLLVLSADLGPAPEGKGPQADDAFKRLGKLAGGILRHRLSTLSVVGDRLELHQTLDLGSASERACVQAARDFLNDEAWWKANLSESGSAAPSPFSMDMSQWFPGEQTL